MADDAASHEALLGALGYRFDNGELLTLALTHRSWCAENPGSESNERLEFLGDAVLDLAIADLLYANEPSQQEGSLAKARAEVVSSPSLAAVARSIELGNLVLLGKGEEQSGGRAKDSILADTIEAVFGAIYLDAGWDRVRGVVQMLLTGVVHDAQGAPGERDYKTRLQELAAEYGLASPTYSVSSSGPDHDLEFIAEVVVGDLKSSGAGQSKKAAQQVAANHAMARLGADTDARQVAVIANSKDAEGHGTGERTSSEG